MLFIEPCTSKSRTKLITQIQILGHGSSMKNRAGKVVRQSKHVLHGMDSFTETCRNSHTIKTFVSSGCSCEKIQLHNKMNFKVVMVAVNL